MFYDKENNERYLKLDLECPLLSEDKLCSIYNYRPMTCATFRNYGKPEDCNG
ncbi:YkgJ family cysteine cluster protein [Roseburia hominis]|nr:YkgJ family cysteine cluster protein [Roseburia hominis]